MRRQNEALINGLAFALSLESDLDGALMAVEVGEIMLWKLKFSFNSNGYNYEI